MHKISQADHIHTHNHEGKARFVVLLTFVVMIVEVGLGYYYNSLTLQANGWHMGAHVLAIGLTWYAYSFERKHKSNDRFQSGTSKIFAVGGYTSSIVLMIVAGLMLLESLGRGHDHEEVRFTEALVVAVVGLIINSISAAVLHHKEDHDDHNLQGAYLHVLADVITSTIAIGTLLAGLYFHADWLDTAGGVIGALIVGRWGYMLAIKSGKDLLDYK